MRTVEQEYFTPYLSEEMRAASRGSFPLSPGIMTGHYAVSRLYWHYRQDVLSNKSVEDIFGNPDPYPPLLGVPEGHRSVSLDGLNRSVWKSFLDTSFRDRPEINVKGEIRSLISTNSNSDTMNFFRRLQGEKSRIVTNGKQNPSLLRAFLYENAFPEKNEFFSWVFHEMRQEVNEASFQGFKEEWSSNLKDLMETWNNYFSEDPFVV